MIYLIGGPPRAGKTILAEALARKTSCPYFTLDHVTSVIVPYIPVPEHPTRLPLRVARRETRFSNDAFYARYATDEIIDFYLRQADTCWPGVENFINYAVEDGHELILEGWQILPHLLHKVVTPENHDALRAVFLYKTNVESIVAGLKANAGGNDWVVKNTKDEATFVRIARMLGRFGEYIEAQARQYGFDAVNTESEFTEKIDESLRAF